MVDPALVRKAQRAVQRAVRAGRLVRPDTCSCCGRVWPNIDAHHHRGYEREFWLDVVWLCRPCHALTRERIPISERARPRRRRKNVPRLTTLLLSLRAQPYNTESTEETNHDGP